MSLTTAGRRTPPRTTVLISGREGAVRDAVERAVGQECGDQNVYVLDSDLVAHPPPSRPLGPGGLHAIVQDMLPRTVIHLGPGVDRPAKRETPGHDHDHGHDHSHSHSPDTEHQARLADLIDACASTDTVCHFVYVGNSFVYPAAPGTPSVLSETFIETSGPHSPARDEPAGQTLAARAAERAVHELTRRRHRLHATILRCAPILGPGAQDLLTAYLKLPAPPKPAGYDARLQFLHLEDLAAAVSAAVRTRIAGTFNIAADGVVSLTQLIRLARRQPLPVPHRTLKACARAAGLHDFEAAHAELLRYGLCLDTMAAQRILGWKPLHTTLETARAHVAPDPHRAPIPWPPGSRRSASVAAAALSATLGPAAARNAFSAASSLVERLSGSYRIDEAGYDELYYRTCAEPLLRLLFERYFTVQVHGLDHVPEDRPTLVVCNHSGTLPIDALMLGYALHRHHHAHRVPRMLGADLIFALPYIGEALRRIGFVTATREDAAHFLHRNELLCVFPEGYKGLGKPYRQRYELQRFGRGGFATAALAHQALIVPAAVIGAEEIYPMLGNAQALARRMSIPYFPLTPTFPWLGPLGLLPLRSRWTIAFGEPLDPADYTRTATGADPSERLAADTRNAVRQLLHGFTSVQHA